MQRRDSQCKLLSIPDLTFATQFMPPEQNEVSRVWSAQAWFLFLFLLILILILIFTRSDGVSCFHHDFRVNSSSWTAPNSPRSRNGRWCVFDDDQGLAIGALFQALYAGKANVGFWVWVARSVSSWMYIHPPSTLILDTQSCDRSYYQATSPDI